MPIIQKLFKIWYSDPEVTEPVVTERSRIIEVQKDGYRRKIWRQSGTNQELQNSLNFIAVCFSWRNQNAKN